MFSLLNLAIGDFEKKQFQTDRDLDFFRFCYGVLPYVKISTILMSGF